MSQFDDDDSKPWTEHDLKEAVRRINAGEINFKEAEDYYGISPRTIHRQRAIENMRAQLNPEKAKKAKTNPSSSSKKDVTVLRKPVDISCSSINDVVALLDTGTEEVKHLLNSECDLIYECKICKNLFRSLLNFISHKRVYCCDMYSVLHPRADDGENGNETNDVSVEDKIKSKENIKEFAAKPFRITCRKDLTSVLKRITSMTEFSPTESVLRIEHLENTSNAYQQTLVNSLTSDANESNKSPSEQPTENIEMSSEADSKPETPTTVPKVPEKSTTTGAVSEKSANYVAEKRFRCPVCAANFTIKKSVMRHLKAVHNQSVEEMEKLKSRIQMHYIRRETRIVENKSSTEEKSSSVVNNSKTENDQTKPEWGKCCPFCNRQFTNRNAFSAHSRNCKNRPVFQESPVESSRVQTASRRSLQPVVSLTPLTSPLNKNEKDVDTVSTLQQNTTNKKPASTAAAPSKKVAASLTTLSSSSSAPTGKKIGIQVRMNYGKANANLATSSSINGNVPSSTYPSTPVSVATSSSSTQSSANNSRRSSFAAPTVRNDEPVMSQPSTITRSSNSRGSIANILETLVDSKNRTNERTCTTVACITAPAAVPTPMPSSEDKKEAEKHPAPPTSGLRKKLPKTKVSIYCEDCETSYILEEYKCDIASNISNSGGLFSSHDSAARSFRCALRNCDFKCDDKRQLVPHLNAKHAVVSEGELATVQSTFIAKSCGSQNECSCNVAKKKNLNGGDKTDTSGTVAIRKASLPNSTGTATGSQTGVGAKPRQQLLQPQSKAQSKLQPPKAVMPQQRLQSAPTLKRKLGAGTQSTAVASPAAKRKPLNVKQSSTGDDLQVVKKESGIGTPLEGAEPVTPPTVKRENSACDEVDPHTPQVPVVKKTKKAPAASVATSAALKSSSATTESKNKLFPRIKIKQTPDKPLVNGVGPNGTSSSSSDEENDLPLATTTIVAATQTTNSKSKINCGVLRKQNAATLPAPDMKPTKTSSVNAKMVNCHNELSSSSSTPDSDLDPSTLTEENLKKSIMTIIFGKDIPTEKTDDREKSPTSSSTSSDSGKEKRYSVRIAKQSTSTKSVVAVIDCREDKMAKIAIPNKVKATR